MSVRTIASIEGLEMLLLALQEEDHPPVHILIIDLTEVELMVVNFDRRSLVRKIRECHQLRSIPIIFADKSPMAADQVCSSDKLEVEVS